MRKRVAVLLAVFFLVFSTGMAGAAESQMQPEEKITINLASRILTFWRDGEKVVMYPVAVGAPESQTPIGSFSVLEKEVNPEWIEPKEMKRRVPSGEDNPLGYRWMGFYSTYGIHGTNQPSSIGDCVSNGCIRLKEDNVEELYELTDIGTPVEIDYERLVIERTSDGRVAYYIYPDGYHRQNLNVSTVKSALAAFGVDGFTTDEEVSEKIKASDGTPTFLPRTYRIEINDLWISGVAVQMDDGLYLPVESLSAVLKCPVGSNWDLKTLFTAYGTVPGKYHGGQWYFLLEDGQKLFNISGAVGKDGILRLNSIQKVNESVQPATDGKDTVVSSPSGQQRDKKAVVTGADSGRNK